MYTTRAGLFGTRIDDLTRAECAEPFIKHTAHIQQQDLPLSNIHYTAMHLSMYKVYVNTHVLHTHIPDSVCTQVLVW
jgi:hypothetical protein